MPTHPELSGATRLAAVIGDPVRHSLSPAIHNAAFAALGMDWAYLALPVPAGQGAEAVAAMRTFGLAGLSVTMPHKADVAAACDVLTPTAAALGVCNTLYWEGECQNSPIVGHSTDGDGFVSSFELDFGRPVQGLRFLVVGAGGAARSIVEALGRHDAAQISVTNRTEAKAASLLELGPKTMLVSQADVADALSEIDVVVNTTAVGMAGGPDPDGIPIPAAALRPEHLVADIVYNPKATPLMKAAAEVGARHTNGLGMLVGQAAEQFARWTLKAAPFDVMLRAVRGVT